jgi:hypothetical protein
VYGVPYVELDDDSGGRLWVTEHGWRHLTHLAPRRWYQDGQYRRRGERLAEGSGAVFRVASEVPGRTPLDLIVKFSRMARDVPLHVSSQFPGDVPRHVLDETSFNDPFQELGLLHELRNSNFGPADLRILTKRPLAIYSPGQHFQAWQLGRTEDLFRRHARLLAHDQAQRSVGLPPVQISIERQYVYLFHRVRGDDARRLVATGVISQQSAADLVRRAVDELAAKGFRMLDIKPSHLILRTRSDGRLVERAGEPAYALVDFELLQRTEPYARWRASRAGQHRRVLPR